jgi:hypothetical protein
MVKSLGVFLRRREPNFVRMTMIEIRAVRPKRRNFKIDSVFEDNDNAKLRADGISVAKNLLNNFGCRIGCHVEILRG